MIPPQHTTGNFRGAGGLKLFFQRWGDSESSKPILVFIHGMAEHSGRYHFPVTYFTSKGFRVYAMDLRGHGDSEGRRAYADSLDQFLEDIHAFLKMIHAQEPGKKIFLVGHSFGGQLALNYGVRYQNGLRGILVSSPNIRLKLQLPFIKRLVTPILSYLTPTLSMGNELDASLVSHEASVVHSYATDKKVLRKITARLGDIILENHSKMMEFAPELRVPIFMMHAGDDLICSPEGTKDFFDLVPSKDKSLKIYKGYYHELFNETGREQVFKDMEAWIEKHT